MDVKIIKLRKKLKKKLDQDRYEHTLGVMYTASALAMKYDCNIEDALVAGLLHDCAKCIPDEKKLSMCSKYHISLSEYEMKNLSLIHAKLGAFWASKKYHVKNQDILNAIESHTTGKPNMNLLEKIIYIADYMEPGRRELPNMKEVRRMAFTDIDECLYLILRDSLKYLRSNDMLIDPMTEQTYEFYKKALGKGDE